MANWFKDAVSRNLRKPEGTLFGMFITKALERSNGYLELEAAKLCEIKPNEKVLEVGYGPGIGLEAAAKLVEGRIYQQRIGIPMGTNYAPLLADLFLYNYEAEFIQQLIRQGGDGTIYGADFSPKMVQTATKRLQSQIKSGKVIICEANVEKLPYEDNMFDKVFHVNCYYFWPDMTLALREILRVMKPDSMILTLLNPDAAKKANERDIMRFGNTDHSRYVDGLKEVGFKNVTIQDLEHSDKPIKVIYAYVGSAK